MKNRKSVYQRHISQLEKSLEARSSWLKAQSLTGKKRRLDPQFRHIEGRLSQYKNRLATIERTEQLVSAKSKA